MNAEDSRRFVLDFFAELTSGNPACWDRVADDATWRLIARGRTYPYPSEYTKASYRRLVEGSAQTFPNGLRFTITATTAEPDRVAVEAESYGHTRDGQLYNNLYHLLVQLGEGRIRSVREYLDSGHATEVLAASAPSQTPTAGQVRTAVERHFRYWNAGDRAAWVANFSDDVTFHDPVGAPPKHGRRAAEKSWDNSFSNGQQWKLELTSLVVCGDEAAITLRNHGLVNGKAFTMEGIEVWKVDAEGRVCQVRAYFQPPADVKLDAYFQRERDVTSD